MVTSLGNNKHCFQSGTGIIYNIDIPVVGSEIFIVLLYRSNIYIFNFCMCFGLLVTGYECIR